MKARIIALILVGFVTSAQADRLIESVQQTLKDQGFYYGEVSGEISANLTAAIRRYQIRNGLQVNGELNSETLRSLGINSSAPSRPATKAVSPSPAAPNSAEESPGQKTNATPAPVQPFHNPPQDEQLYPPNPVAPGISKGGVLAGTPFEAAPPQVQRNLIASAQIALARRGVYQQEITGVYGPAMELSLRAYQARAKLPVTGRLDLQTLAALRLLPRPREPFYDPSRRRWRQPPGAPPRGEWVPE
jgi:peptidoglycan hydrolase-like protein with peptidoglycan-binding domain